MQFIGHLLFPVESDGNLTLIFQPLALCRREETEPTHHGDLPVHSSLIKGRMSDHGLGSRVADATRLVASMGFLSMQFWLKASLSLL